ncbi:MAG TPA: hypothetical protein VMX14_13480 [Anaerolineae bacterium]|nr:hypothetical protein [Anaerolineae bacterium]
MVDQLTYEQATEWCERRQVTVSFLRIHGRARVQIRFDAAIIVERDTFLQAVRAAQLIEDRQPK